MIPEILAIVSIMIFGISHSLFATKYVKNKIPLSQKVYRIFYVIVATLSLFILEIVIGNLANDPNHISYQPITGISSDLITFTNILSILGVLIVTGSLIQSNPFKFVGLRSENYNKDLKTSFFYKFSRHPMYFGALLMFVPILFLTNNLVIFIKYFGYSIYFILGAILEERRMTNLYPNYIIMYSRGFLFPWKLRHLRELFSFINGSKLV